MNDRKSNFELLRIVSMLFIVVYHVIVHGKVIENSTNQMFITIMEFVIFTIVIHVNCFVLLTGYFQIDKKFKQKKLWSITNASLFYKIVIMVILAIIGIIKIDQVTIIKEISPINIDDYWFIKNYLFLYCLSPFLNKLALSLSKKDYHKMIIVMTIIFSVIPYITGAKAFENNGFTLCNFIYLYFIGGYLKLYKIKDNYIFKPMTNSLYKLTLKIIFISCILINFSFFITSDKLLTINPLSGELFGNIYVMSKLYSNPFVILQAVSFFLIFEKINIQSKIINFISKLTFGIYLIHDNIFITKYLYKWLNIDNGRIESYRVLLNIILATIFIFGICGFIEFIRQILFKFIYNRKISGKIRNKYYKFIIDLKFKDEVKE